MKKLATAAAAIAACAAAPAWAQSASDTQDVVINTAVQPECSAANPVDVNFNTVPIVETAGANALLISADDTVPNQNVWLSCNYATSIEMSSANQGLVNPAGIGTADPGEFTALIHYRLSLVASDFSFDPIFVFTFNNQTDNATAASAFHSNTTLSVKIELDDNTARRPVAGSYSDTATIELGPI